MDGYGQISVSKAPDFALKDQDGNTVTLADALVGGPVMLAFYPGDFTPTCTKQLCNYRDKIDDFKQFPVNVYGVSSDSPESHKRFVQQNGFPFKLLSDPDKSVAKAYGCTSFLMFGGVSRAVVIINPKGLILYRYVEPTIITRRKADELIGILSDLRKNKLI